MEKLRGRWIYVSRVMCRSPLTVCLCIYIYVRLVQKIVILAKRKKKNMNITYGYCPLLQYHMIFVALPAYQLPWAQNSLRKYCLRFRFHCWQVENVMSLLLSYSCFETIFLLTGQVLMSLRGDNNHQILCLSYLPAEASYFSKGLNNTSADQSMTNVAFVDNCVQVRQGYDPKEPEVVHEKCCVHDMSYMTFVPQY